MAEIFRLKNIVALLGGGVDIIYIIFMQNLIFPLKKKKMGKLKSHLSVLPV